MVGLTAFSAGDYVTARAQWEPLANLGDAYAHLGLGWLAEIGDGVRSNFAMAA